MLILLSRIASRLLIRLHPQPFRDEFGSEMQSVVEEKINDAHHSGILFFASSCIYEIGSLLGNLLAEHYLSLKGEFSMNISRRIHLYSLILPLVLSLVVLLVNPNFVLKLFTGILGLFTTLTIILAIAFIAFTLQPQYNTPHSTALSPALALVAMGCLLFGPVLVMVIQFEPMLLMLQYSTLAILILIDIAIITLLAASLIGSRNLDRQSG